MADTGAILVIDDDRAIAETLREFLEFRGRQVEGRHARAWNAVTDNLFEIVR